MFVGGDILEIQYNHPTLGDGTFFPKSNEETSFDTGGFRTEDDMDAVAGNGQSIKKVTRKRWMFEGPIAWDKQTNRELQALSALAADPVDAQWTVTAKDGSVWTGLGAVVGDVVGNALDSTIPTKISGGEAMQQIQ